MASINLDQSASKLAGKKVRYKEAADIRTFEFRRDLGGRFMFKGRESVNPDMTGVIHNSQHHVKQTQDSEDYIHISLDDGAPLEWVLVSDLQALIK